MRTQPRRSVAGGILHRQRAGLVGTRCARYGAFRCRGPAARCASRAAGPARVPCGEGRKGIGEGRGEAGLPAPGRRAVLLGDGIGHPAGRSQPHGPRGALCRHRRRSRRGLADRREILRCGHVQLLSVGRHRPERDAHEPFAHRAAHGRCVCATLRGDGASAAGHGMELSRARLRAAVYPWRGAAVPHATAAHPGVGAFRKDPAGAAVHVGLQLLHVGGRAARRRERRVPGRFQLWPCKRTGRTLPRSRLHVRPPAPEHRRLAPGGHSRRAHAAAQGGPSGG